MSLFRNWTMHNLISHPMSEVVWLILRPFSVTLAKKYSDMIHDCTLPIGEG